MNINSIAAFNVPVFAGDFKHKKNNYLLNKASEADFFAHSLPHLDPAYHNNLIYAIDDEFLASIFPSELVKKYTNPNFLKIVDDVNPNISTKLSQVGVPLKIYGENITSEIRPHFLSTLKAAFAIMKNMQYRFSKEEYLIMEQAALLHDIGKVYIPDYILNKKGKLDTQERKIVDTHAELGYEILRTTYANADILPLVKGHHTYSTANPILLQILEVSDIWSALKEKRPYKRIFSDSESLKILYERANNGDFDKSVVDSLARAIKIKL